MRLFAALAVAASLSHIATAAPLPSAAHTVLPAEVQQVISVDQRALRNSAVAQDARAQLLPSFMKQFETGLRQVGIDPQQDVNQAAYVTYRSKEGLRLFAVAQGNFSAKSLLARMQAQKAKPAKHRTADIYPMSSGLAFTMLDAGTILFGDNASVRRALDARDRVAAALDAQNPMRAAMAEAAAAPVWSVLDSNGVRHLLQSALPDAASSTELSAVKGRLLGGSYSLEIGPMVQFEMRLATPDNTAAAVLASGLKAGLVLRRVKAGAVERQSLDQMNVVQSGNDVAVRFSAEERRFRALLGSDLLTAVQR